ncbi:MAG: hypothetical protein CBB78_001680 [Roseibacillus sp. TMED18]|nr:MAG: hypothetical protein CBB78_001680 [Roseibacillus sp. TMED18]
MRGCCNWPDSARSRWCRPHICFPGS